MGNNCVSGIIAKDGLFNSISHSLRWSKSSDNIIIVYDKNKENIGQEPSQKAIKSRISIEINPPELVKIDDEKEDNKLSQPIKLEPTIIVKEVWPKQQPQTTDKMSEEAPKNDVEKSDQVVESAFSKEAQKPKKVDHVRRTMSLGLRVESVLKTKMGHLKDHFSLGHKLGHGQYGTTFLCTEKLTGKEFACKSIAKRKLLTHEDLRDVRREIEIMHHLSENPNVISIKGAYEDSVAVHVVMELCKGGELFDRIVQRGYYPEKKAAELTRTIIGVIESCHSSGVMHCDIKPENFLFVDNDEDSQMKTIDFGLSVFFKPGEIFTEVVGSPFYVAPEVLRKRYGPEADIWSAGVLVYILLSGVSPFWGETEQELFEDILHGDIDFASDPWPGISDSAKDLVKRMLVRDPRKRITARQLLCHPWLQVAGGVRLRHHDKPLDSDF